MSKPTYEELEKRVKELEKSNSKYKQSDERLLNSFIEQNPFPTWISDKKGIMILANPALKKVLNLTDEQLIGKYNVFNDPQVEEQGLIQVIRDTLEKGKTSDFVLVWDGYNVADVNLEGSNKVDVEGTIFPIFDNDGKVTNAVITYKEVSERKKAEEALKKSEEKFRALVETSSDIIWEVNQDGKFTYISPNVKDIWGYEKKEVIGKTPFDFVIADELESMLKMFQEEVNSAKPFSSYENKYLHKDGRHVVIETSGSPVLDGKGNLQGYRGVNRDITERKIAEKALKEGEEKFRLLFENAPLGYQSLDEEGNFIEVNNAWLETLGYAYDEVIGHNFSEFIADDFREVFIENFPKFKKIGYILGIEFEMVKKDGTEVLVSFYGRIGHDESGEFRQTHCILKDITAQRIAEEKLIKSEEKFRNVLENSYNVIYSFNLETGTYDYLSPSAEKIYGYTPEEIIEGGLKKSISRFHPEDVMKIDNHLKQLLSKELVDFSPTVEYRFKHPELGYRWISDTRAVIFDDDNNPVSLIGNSSDITDRKIAEEALIKERNTLHVLINTIPYPIYFKDTEGKFIECNDSNIKNLSYASGRKDLKKTDVLGRTDHDFLPRDLADRFREDEKRIILGEKTQINELYTNKERSEYSLNTKIPFADSEGKTIGLVCINHNITEQKKAEEELQIQKTYFEELLNNSPEAVVLHDNEGKILLFNNEFLSLYGFEKNEVLGNSIDEIIVPENLYSEGISLTKALSEGKRIDVDTIRKQKNGKLIDVSLLGAPVSSNKKQIGNYCIYRDITERKKSEKELRESEKRLRTAIIVAPFPIMIHTDNGKVLQISNIWTELTGYTIEDIPTIQAWSENAYQQKHKETGTYITTLFDEIFESGKIRKEGEFEIHTKDNRIVIWDFSSAPLGKLPDNRRLMLTMAVDVTERKNAENEKKQLEHQLFQSQKLESIGRLAGGIAHDFNNILTGIMGYADLLKMKFPDITSIEGKAADVIYKGSERAAGLTSQLLGFARKGKYNPVVMNINEQIKETIRVSEMIFEKNINVKYDLEEKIHKIEADVNQIGQVLTNLIVNAKDAMPKGGELSFKTEKVYLDEEYVRIYQYLKPGDYVKLNVSDTGTGMPKVVKDSIFEPFYTTKGEGKGTGLGLAMVFGIMKNHGGHINVYSEPDEGTTFTLYFPASEKKILKTVKNENIIKGIATILIIDDEEHVRELSKSLLEKMGYIVFSAENGKKGLEIYKEKKKNIDLVLLDIIMPEMSGEETFKRLISYDPDIKVLIISGFSKEEKAMEMLNGGAMGFIQKPFNAADLSLAINKAVKG